MKSTLFRLVIGTALGLGPVQAMYDAQEEDKATLPQTKAPQQNTTREKTSTSTSFKEDVSFESLPGNLFASICSFLDIRDLGQVARVSTRWKRVTDDPVLWRYMGSRYYGDYLSKEDLKEGPKQKVISHYLSVIVNAKVDLKEIERLVNYYRLDLYISPIKWTDMRILFNLIKDSSYEMLITQGYQAAIEKMLVYLEHSCRYYEKDSSTEKTARKLNEYLIEKGNSKAIKRKVEGLLDGIYGYEKNPLAAREFNELLVEKGDQAAIEIKINGFFYGRCGYEKNSLAAREFNELLVEKGDQAAIERKIRGLSEGLYDYEKDLTAAREFNELLIKRGNIEAINRKIEGLANGRYGYEKDQIASKNFNEILVEMGDPEAIERKIKGLGDGRCGYQKDPDAARELNEFLVEKSDQMAIKRKIDGLRRGGDMEPNYWGPTYYPTYGYKKDPEALEKFYRVLVTKSNIEAINTKLEDLVYINPDCPQFGTKRNQAAAREFIESLSINEIPITRGIGKYIKAFAMKYGITELGYEKDYEKALGFIKHNHVPY